MYFTLFGPREDHGATCLHLAFDDGGLLFDAGLDPVLAGWEALADTHLMTQFPEQYRVDSILISHAHLDHMGGLPHVAARFPDASILMTEETWHLTRMQLCRHAMIWQHAYDEGLADYPLFTPADVQELESRIQLLRKGEAVESRVGTSGSVRITPWDAGHILGSCAWQVEQGSRSLYYTADVCGRPQSVIQGAVYPPSADIVVTESTIGWSDRHVTSSRKQEIEALARTISEVATLGGSILIPVFNMGRAQELLFILHSLKRREKIPPIPVHVGRSAWEIAKLYDRFAAGDRRLLPDFLFEETLVDIVDDADEIELGADSRIYLVPSGMLHPESPSWKLARRMLPHPLHAILFVGHTRGGSFGKTLMQSAQGDELDFDGHAVTRHCRLESFLFSSHSNRAELVSMVERIQPSRLVLLPGRKDSVDQVKQELTASMPELRVEEALPGQELDLIS
jgi:cleavage and polyadenylation specificity factor subunit 3